MPHQISARTRPAATAAHPRAFRGTKYRPPKLAVDALNLHAWIADDRLLDGFFARHDFANLPVLGPDGNPWPADKFIAGKPTVAALRAAVGHSAGADLPSVFRRNFFWMLRDRPANQCIAWLNLWRGLGAPSQGGLLPILARLCALDASAHWWAEKALGLPKVRQAAFLLCLLRHQSYRLQPDQMSSEQLAAIHGLSDEDARFESFLDIALDNLGRGVSVAYTLIGCRLPASGTSSDVLTQGLRATVHAEQVPVVDIARMLAAVGDGGMHWARSAWESCATQPGFARVLTETSWELLESPVADRWLSLFRVSEWDFANPALRAAQWRVRLGMFSGLQRQLLALPADRRERFVAMQNDYVCDWDDPVTLQNSWPVVLPLQVRLCGPMFPARATGNGPLSAIAIHLHGGRLQNFAEICDETWLVIEHACRRDNNAVLIRRGLYGLAEAMPDFLLFMLASAPKRLMRSMSLLGCLEYNLRRRLFAHAAGTPWFATDWEAMPALTACERLLRLCTEYELDSPLPRRLREHLGGNPRLSEAQLARHCRVTLSRLPSAQLAALEVMAWRHIDGPFNLRNQSTGANHAVRLHASIDGGNKKTLRRFLLGYANSGIHSYLDHPLNRQWYAQHPRINPALWGSIEFRELIDDGAISISIETDPFEILMLGSYVGSCLGLGGLCEYSSVACLVDANKQVAYARDADGCVIARQLLAIDEHERLVCFAVYPQTATAQVRQAFARFNVTLARSLGLNIYTNGDDKPYEIKIILAVEWWDDGQWHNWG